MKYFLSDFYWRLKCKKRILTSVCDTLTVRMMFVLISMLLGEFFRISFANQHRRESTIPILKIWNVPISREKFTIISFIISYSNEPENIKTWFDWKTIKKMFQKEYKGVLRKGIMSKQSSNSHNFFRYLYAFSIIHSTQNHNNNLMKMVFYLLGETNATTKRSFENS